MKKRQSKHFKAQNPSFLTRGITGTQLNNGYITGYEQNPSFTDPARWAEECIEMYRTDPVVRRSFNILKQTLLSASWRWVAADEESEDCLEYARYANECWGLDGYVGQMSQSWEAQLSYLFEYLKNGFRVAEEVYKLARDENGRMMVFLDHYADREPTSIYKFLTLDDQNLDGVMQWGVNGLHPQPIPANKMILLTLGQTGSNFAGDGGFFRPCHFYWRSKQRALSLLMIGIERFTSPTPVVKVDRSQAESLGMSDEDINAAVDEAEAQAAAYTAHEAAYLVTSPAVSFETYGGTNSSFNPDMALSVVREADQQISTAFLAQMLELGRVGSDTGSRAVGEVHMSLFRRSALNIADYVASVVSGVDRRGAGTIGRLIKFNYGDVSPSKLPRLEHTGLDVDALAESLASLPLLVQSSLLTPDNELERMIRQRVGAGDLPEEAERSSIDRSMSQGGQGSALGEYIKRRMKNG